MIALDFDGVVANYGDHTTQLRLNDGLFALLPRRTHAGRRHAPGPVRA